MTPESPPAFLRLHYRWRGKARLHAGRVAGMVLAGMPRYISDPDRLKDATLRNVRARLEAAAGELDPAIREAIEVAGYGLADYIDGMLVHYEHIIGEEVDRIVAERAR